MLSIVVPIYNAEKYLSECIESIICQTYMDIELILIDNASTDNSRCICEKYRKKDSRIRIYDEQHRGPFYARKKGVEMAKGEYITFADSDDFVSKHSYEYARDEMQNGVDIVCFGIKRFFTKDNIKEDIVCTERKTFDKKAMSETIIPTMIWNKEVNSYGIDPSLCNKIFKANKLKSLFDEIESIDFHYGEDAAVFYPFMISADSMVSCPLSYYFHRQRLNGDIPLYIKDVDFFDKLLLLYKWLSKRMRSISTLQEQVDLFYINSVNFKKKQYGIANVTLNEVFPFDKIPQGENVVIFGAGNVGRLYVNQITKLKYCANTLWVDSNFREMGDDINSPELIRDFAYDYIVIAVANEYTWKQIFMYLIDELGVPQEKIVMKRNID